ncbi:MAG: class I SAM-dependent methyltransferase [archaeon]
MASHLVMEKEHMNKLYNSKNFLVRFFHNQRLNSILHFIPEKQANLKVLDAGCGEGHLLEAIYQKNPKLKLYGVDVTKIALSSTKKRLKGKAKISMQDITKLKFPKGYFDIIICSDALEHIFDYNQAVSNLKNAAKNKGIIIVSYPNELNLIISRFLMGITPAKAQDHVNSFSPVKMKKEFNLPVAEQFNLPVNLPFIFSLEAVQAFTKK